MDKKIKDLIALKKLTDNQIYTLLSAELPDADQDQEEDPTNENSAEEQAAQGEEESDAEEDAAIEQPKLEELINQLLDKKLKEMKKGKPKPIITNKTKKIEPFKPLSTDSFQLI